MKKREFNALALGLYPWLSIYSSGIPIFSIGQAIIVLLFMIDIFKKGLSIETFYFKVFFFYAFIVSVLGCLIIWVEPLTVIHDVFSIILFGFILYSSIKYVDYGVLKKTIRVFGLVSMGFFLFQYAMSIAGIQISGIIPFIPLKEGDNAEIIAKQLGSMRASGFFSEPAHYSQFMVIVLMIYLFLEEKNYKNIIISIVITFTLLLSQSSTGYALFTMMWFVWFLHYTRSSKHRFVMMIVLSIAFSATIVAIMSNALFSEAFGRFVELDAANMGESTHGYSTHIRMVRGYSIFAESDFFGKLFGHGLGSHNCYIDTHPQSSFFYFTSAIPHWINSFQYLLFSVGIFGTILYYTQLISLFKKTTRAGKVCVVILAMLFFASDYFYGSFLILYIIIMEIRMKRREYNLIKPSGYDFSSCSNI